MMHENNNTAVLTVRSVTKRYAEVCAVNNISFSVARGDVFAFLGPNGAGKTTTLRMLLDIIRPDSGEIKWNLEGKTGKRTSAGQIGYLPEERGLYTDIPVMRSLVYLASIRGMDPGKAKKSAMEWLERLGLADRANEKLQALSKGNQQKIQFIASILHEPVFAILDEPFSGLDPLNQENFIGYIREISAKGTTILLSAHQMSLVEKIAGRIFLINNGQEVYNGTLPGIFETFGSTSILDVRFLTICPEELLRGIPGIKSVQRIDDTLVQLTLGSGAVLNRALSELAAIDGICDITSRKQDLHGIFLQLIKPGNHELS
jgi:ABC-2 type transport system ATP-binding protein